MTAAIRIITNTQEDDALWEDSILRDQFHAAGAPDVEILDIRNAPQYISDWKGTNPLACLIRNVWPVRELDADLHAMQLAAQQANVLISPPPRKETGLYHEDKHYLTKLFDDASVPPTYLSGANLTLPPLENGYVLKPLDGCSSIGVERIAHDDPKRLEEGSVIQPWLTLENEVSFYFVDSEFVYATLSAGAGPEFEQRWIMTDWQPSNDETSWAKKYQDMAFQGHGLIRIDAGRLKDEQDSVKRLRLMEIETLSPFLSFDAANENSQHRIASALVKSIEKAVANPQFLPHAAL
jgi:hypothetical protein